MPAIPNTRVSQAPLFRAKPELIPADEPTRRSPTYAEDIQIVAASLVTPLAVFAAGRKTFDCIVRSHDKSEALELIFIALPLYGNGWRVDKTEIERVRRCDEWPVWRISRGE